MLLCDGDTSKALFKDRVSQGSWGPGGAGFRETWLLTSLSEALVDSACGAASEPRPVPVARVRCLVACGQGPVSLTSAARSYPEQAPLCGLWFSPFSLLPRAEEAEDGGSQRVALVAAFGLSLRFPSLLWAAADVGWGLQVHAVPFQSKLQACAGCARSGTELRGRRSWPSS